MNGLEILTITSGNHDAGCKCCSVNVEEALQSILGNQFFRERLEFSSTIQQEGLFEILRSKTPDLFSEPQRRTLFLRQTGDNLGSQPTKQLSFSIFKLEKPPKFSIWAAHHWDFSRKGNKGQSHRPWS